MNELVVVPPIAVPMCLADREIAAALSYAEQEKSEGTRKAYRADFRAFTVWCLARGLEAMPATAAAVARFLSSEADRGIATSTIGRRCAAIAYAHKLAGFEPPTSIETVRAVVRGIRRSIGTAPAARKLPATADVIGEMLKHCPDTLRGKRDAALLALGFAMAARRSELVALTVADLVEAPDGFRVMIRRSKTDQEGAGQEVAVPRGCRIEPVKLVQAWLTAAGITEGFIFRQVAKDGRVQAEPISGHSAAAIVKRHAALAGLDSAAFAGHSLRAGFITSAAEAGASVFKLQEVSRHKSVICYRFTYAGGTPSGSMPAQHSCEQRLWQIRNMARFARALSVTLGKRSKTPGGG
jgi:site-specific recombinase XerD